MGSKRRYNIKRFSWILGYIFRQIERGFLCKTIRRLYWKSWAIFNSEDMKKHRMKEAMSRKYTPLLIFDISFAYFEFFCCIWSKFKEFEDTACVNSVEVSRTIRRTANSSFLPLWIFDNFASEFMVSPWLRKTARKTPVSLKIQPVTLEAEDIVRGFFRRGDVVCRHFMMKHTFIARKYS